MDNPLKEQLLHNAFKTHWPELEATLCEIQSVQTESQESGVDVNALLHEILGVVRRIEKDGLGRGGGPDNLFGQPPSSPTVGPGGGSSGGLLDLFSSAEDGTESERIKLALRRLRNRELASFAPLRTRDVIEQAALASALEAYEAAKTLKSYASKQISSDGSSIAPDDPSKPE